MDHLRAVELRHLRHFVAVAEEKHFGRAAERLFLSQPSLSHSIRQLEELLGCSLLDRSDRKRVTVTPSGEALLAHAREVDAQLYSALRDVQSQAAGQVQPIRVGYNDGEPLAQRPTALRAATKGVGRPVAFRRLPWGDELAALRRGDVDVLLTRLPIEGAGLQYEMILEEPLRLCVANDHPLARRRKLRIAEIASLPVVRPIGGSQAWQDHWRGLPRPNGRKPPDGPEVHSPEETFDVVMSGVAACFVPASMITEGTGGAVRTLEVEGVHHTTLVFAWRGALRAWHVAFADAARSLASALR